MEIFKPHLDKALSNLRWPNFEQGLGQRPPGTPSTLGYPPAPAVSPGQLKEVVKVLEKLNRSGRWKWLLHYKESKKLREDVR